MNLGRFEIDNIYNEDCYKAIKDLPDKSVDCIYTDVPYLMSDNSRVGGFMKDRVNKIINTELKDFNSGFDLTILNEFVRINKTLNIYIYGAISF